MTGHLTHDSEGLYGHAVGTAGEVSGETVHRGAVSPSSWWIVTVSGRPSPPMRGPWAMLLVESVKARGLGGTRRRASKPPPPVESVHLATHVDGLTECRHRVGPMTTTRADVTCPSCLRRGP